MVKYEEGVRDPFFQITYLGDLMFFCLCSGQFHIPDIWNCQADSGLNLNSDRVELLIYTSWVHRLQKKKLPKLTKYTFLSNLGPVEELGPFGSRKIILSLTESNKLLGICD